MGAFRDLVGQTFGRLVVLSRAPNRGHNARWHCRCECDNEKTVYGCHLTLGRTKSCGCFRAEDTATRLAECNRTHGMSKSRTFRKWSGMLYRCSNENSPNYHLYGGRGIAVCERWLSFELFLEDMGEAPPGLTLDRFPDQNGDYNQSNCRWATPTQQSRNRRFNHMVTFEGETHCLSEWCEKFGNYPELFNARRKDGWSFVAALTTPPKKSPRRALAIQ